MVEGSDDVRRDLLARIAAERALVQAHLRRHRPRSRRLTTATIVLTSLAAAFTAGPGVGGGDFTGAVQDALGLEEDAGVWRVLCLAAAVVSVAAAVVAGLSKSQEAAARLNTAEAVDSELEGLAFLLEFGQVSIEDAVKLFQQYIVKTGFIEEDASVAGAAPSGTVRWDRDRDRDRDPKPVPVAGRRSGELPPVPAEPPPMPRRLSPRGRTRRQRLPPPPH
jgi:hypothetical protein